MNEVSAGSKQEGKAEAIPFSGKSKGLGIVVSNESGDTKDTGITSGDLSSRDVSERSTDGSIIEMSSSNDIEVGRFVSNVADIDGVDLSVGGD